MGRTTALLGLLLATGTHGNVPLLSPDQVYYVPRFDISLREGILSWNIYPATGYGAIFLDNSETSAPVFGIPPSRDRPMFTHSVATNRAYDIYLLAICCTHADLLFL